MPRITPTRAALTALLLLAAGVASYFTATTSSATPGASSNSGKPGLSLQIAPASQTVTRGRSVTYTVTVVPVNGLTGTAVLTAAGLPPGTTGQFSPGSVQLAGAGAQSVLTVAAGSTATLGNATFTVTGTAGKVSDSIGVGLSVSPASTGALSLGVTPADATLAPGSTAVYTVQLTRTAFSGPVNLAVTGLPVGATASFQPAQPTGNTSTLQVVTAGSTPDGSYPLTVLAGGRDDSGQQRAASAGVQLTVASNGKPFGISGNLPSSLTPGRSVPLDLTLANPNHQPLAISNLTVSVQTVTRTPDAAAAGRPCPLTDFAVVQYSGGYPLTVPATASSTLSQLGVPAGALPQVVMRDTSSNQDGCKGATLSLGYAGSGKGN